MIARAAILCATLALGLPAAVRAGDCAGGVTDVVTIGASRLCVVIEDASASRRALLRTWIERSAHIVADYYAMFPASLVTLKIREVAGAGIGGGRTTNDEGLLIRVSVGSSTSAALLTDDWVLVHEMIHLALPEVGRRHDWLAEGLAVYVEGVARAQHGNRSVSDVWAEDRRSMPGGQPKAGEGGMDQTSTWARTYWGGALFCLRADVEMRRQTHDRVGLQTALREILAQTGGYASQRDIDEVFAIGDRATGTHVLADLYAQQKSSAAAIDLDALFRALGVPEDPAHQPFDDRAPLAAIRMAITMPLGAQASKPP